MPATRFFGMLLAFLACLSVPAISVAADAEEDSETKKWEEMEAPFPPMPKQQDLIEFFVSAATDNRFFVDSAAISVGGDGVVRYTLVVLTASGVRNVSFEGMRCDTKERRLYAFGRSDGTWSKSRSNRWDRVREVVGNRHHAALFQEYFCPGGIIVRNADEAKKALQQGGFPTTLR